MNLLTSIPFLKRGSKSPKQIINESWDTRHAILESNTNLFCWKRPVDIVISSYLGQLLERDLPPIKFHANINDIDQKVANARLDWDQEPIQAADLFWADASRLIRDFLHYSESQSGTVHLKVIDNNSCSKFHTDGYALRLFTTYYGKGTEWLPESATNRKGLGKINELIVKDSSQIQCMKPFEVGILKGELPNRINPMLGIVHRSPEIENAGEKRITLRIDI